MLLEERITTLEPLSTVFCDNIVVYCIIPSEQSAQFQNVQKYISKKTKTEKANKDDVRRRPRRKALY
jgi:hypothetical protein